MRILMLGNSFTAYNDLAGKVADLTGAEVVRHTRGGARLSEQLNPETKMGAKTIKALEEEQWDYVVIQAMSKGPIIGRKAFLRNVRNLSKKIRESGAIPVLYGTWAFMDGSPVLAKTKLTYEEMHQKLHEGFLEAVEENHILLADVGTEFYNKGCVSELYSEDGRHPSVEGTEIAARIISEVILKADKKTPVSLYK